MLAHEIKALKKLGIPLKQWGNTFRVQIRGRNGRKTYISNISDHKEQLAKQYPKAFRNADAVKNTLDREVSGTIIRTIRSSMAKNDNASIKAINSKNNKVELTLERFNRIRRNIESPADKKLLVHFTDSNGETVRTYHLNEHIKDINNLFLTEDNQFSSGADVDLTVLPSSKVIIEWLDNPKRSRSERKNFFRYLTKAHYGLEEFQVYSNKNAFYDEHRNAGFDPESKSDYGSANYPCFLYSLLKAGVCPKLIKQISQTMYSSGATVDFIRKTAIAFNLYISVKQYQLRIDTGRINSKVSFYGNKNDNIIKLGSVGEHLFAIRPTNITKSALEYPDLVNRHSRADFIVINEKAYFNNKRIKYLDSFDVISYLYHHREELLNVITQANMPHLLNNKFQEVRAMNEYDFNDSNFREIGRVKGKEIKNGQAPFTTLDEETVKYVEVDEFNVVYFDFETLVKDSKHIPYCVSYCLAVVKKSDSEPPSFSKTKTFYGFDCAERFLNSLPRNSKNLLWAHNAGFDCRFLLKHMIFNSNKGCNMIDSGTRLKQSIGSYYGRDIIIKDTMSFLNDSLSNLPEMFVSASKSISLEKECFPHNLINDINFEEKWPLSYLDSYEDKETLIKNATNIGAIKDGFFDCKKYAIHYCERDVNVLRACFEEFRNLVNKQFNLDIYRFVSISSLSISYQHNEGCFDDCYEVNSVLLGFLREATVGGRCMTRDNEKHHIKHKLSDFDAVSLYPSAMAELKGYIKGKPKLFKDSIPDKADYYVVRVRIDSIGIKRHFALMSYYENGSRNFTNDVVGKIMIMGKQALEDLVEFQGATYTVIEGLYWDEGFNDKIVSTITNMFSARLKYKKEGNPLQNVLKLMMNSSYGKLLMKPIVKQKTIVSGGKAWIEEYTRKNIHKLISRTPINKNLALFEEHKPLNQHYAPVHLGIQILDSSKHIMNRVMCLAEDIDARIWYQDTDSMHIDYDSVSRLALAFKQKYNKELIGKNMGQFHTDFKLDGAEGEIYAKESIFLGKKSYLDILACEGNDVEGFHIRMKGIPSKLLETDTYQTYIDLYNGKTKWFNLTDLCPIEINTKTQKVSKRANFIRKIRFK